MHRFVGQGRGSSRAERVRDVCCVLLLLRTICLMFGPWLAAAAVVVDADDRTTG